MTTEVFSKLYFLADEYVRLVDKLDGRYFVWAEDQRLRVGQTLYFPKRDKRCSILKITLVLGKKIDVNITESGHKYFLDFDDNIGPIERSSYLECYLE